MRGGYLHITLLYIIVKSIGESGSKTNLKNPSLVEILSQVVLCVVSEFSVSSGTFAWKLIHQLLRNILFLSEDLGRHCILCTSVSQHLCRVEICDTTSHHVVCSLHFHRKFEQFGEKFHDSRFQLEANFIFYSITNTHLRLN